jgi:hypothetical protein
VQRSVVDYRVLDVPAPRASSSKRRAGLVGFPGRILALLVVLGKVLDVGKDSGPLQAPYPCRSDLRGQEWVFAVGLVGPATGVLMMLTVGPYTTSLPFAFASAPTTRAYARASEWLKLAASPSGAGIAVDSPWRGPSGPSV